MNRTAVYDIIPLKVGEFHGIEHSALTLNRNQGKKIITPLIMYLVRNEDRTLLVDCGGSDEAWSAKHHTRIVRSPEETPEAALAAHGVDCGTLETLVLTHLHWDHCFNTRLFPRAAIFVQRGEMEYALDPLPPDRRFYEAAALGFTPPWAKDAGRMTLVEGDHNLAPGIDLVFLPGHTPGFQGVLVNTRGGRCLIAGDCLGLAANWPGNDRYSEAVPSGLYSSLRDYYATFKKISMICDNILPGHDFGVFAGQCYPGPESSPQGCPGA